MAVGDAAAGSTPITLSGEEAAVKKKLKTISVFHISPTELLDRPRKDHGIEIQAELLAAIDDAGEGEQAAPEVAEA